MSLHYVPLLASLCYYGTIFIICEVGRRLGRTLVATPRQLIFLNEFFGTLQVCTMTFENGMILRHYGLVGFFLVVAVAVIVHTATLGDAYASPCPVFEESALHRSRFNELLLRFAAQVAAGLTAFRLAKLVWGLGFVPDHSSLAEKYQCSSDLHTPLLQGVLLEMAASFIIRLIWLKTNETYRNGSPILTAVVVSTVVILGLNKTGMYLNPILAFSLNYGCKGTEPLEHFLVYWIGPTIGWMLATEVDARTKSARY